MSKYRSRERISQQSSPAEGDPKLQLCVSVRVVVEDNVSFKELGPKAFCVAAGYNRVPSP